MLNSLVDNATRAGYMRKWKSSQSEFAIDQLVAEIEVCRVQARTLVAWNGNVLEVEVEVLELKESVCTWTCSERKKLQDLAARNWLRARRKRRIHPRL